MDTPAQILSTLIERGFTVLDQIAELSVTAPIPGVTYLYCSIDDPTWIAAGMPEGLRRQQHQYVSVIASPFTPDEHLETIIEVYNVARARKACPGGLPSHDRMERGFSPVYANIRRSLSLILADLDAPHPLPPRPPKRS